MFTYLISVLWLSALLAAGRAQIPEDQTPEEKAEVGKAYCAALGGTYDPLSNGTLPCSQDVPILDQTKCTSTGGKIGEFCTIDKSKCIQAPDVPVCVYPIPEELKTPAAVKAFQGIFETMEKSLNKKARLRRIRRRRIRRRM